jgi:hypothetical protein
MRWTGGVCNFNVAVGAGGCDCGAADADFGTQSIIVMEPGNRVVAAVKTLSAHASASHEARAALIHGLMAGHPLP